MEKKYTIYALRHCFTGHPFYIGQTVKRLKRRLSDHICAAKLMRDSEVYQYMRTLADPPFISEVEVFYGTKLEARKRELFWIEEYRSRGFDLKNHNAPFKEYTPGSVSISSDVIDKLIKYKPFLSYLKSIGVTDLRQSIIGSVIKKKKCRPTTKEKIQRLIDGADLIDFSLLRLCYNSQMVIVPDNVKEKLLALENGCIRRAARLIGTDERNIKNAIIGNPIRYDKYHFILKSINTC